MISVLSPWFLLLSLPALGLLVWAYRSQGSGERMTVGSLLLLEQIQERVVFKRKFVPPIRFFVELLIFLLLVAALSGVVSPTRIETLVIVVDNSESTGHKLPSGKSVLESAKEYLTTWLPISGSGKRGSNPRYRILITSPTVQELTEQPVQRSEVQEIVSSVQPVAGVERLQQAVRSAGQFENVHEILVLSDQKVEAAPSVSSISLDTFAPSIPSEVLSNVAIERARFIVDQASITVDIRSFSKLPRDEVVTLLEVQGIPTALRFEVVRRAPVTLAAGESKTVTFKNVEKRGLYLLELGDNGDSLEADNVFWLWSEGKVDTVPVRSPLSVPELGLIPFPEMNYVSSSVQGVEDAPFWITHQQAGDIDRIPGLHVLPVKNGGPESARQQVRSAGKIVNVREQHPVLDYMDLSSLNFDQVIPLAVPSWAEPLIEVEAGVIAYMGLSEGNPIVVLGFELFPLSGGKTPTRTVLFLNIIKWLSASSSGSSATRVPGETLKRDSPEERLVFASARLQTFEPVEGSVVPAERGVVVSGEQVIGVVQFFSAEESGSQLGNVKRVGIPVEKRTETQVSESSTRLWIWLVLGFLLVDLFCLGFTPRYAVRS